VSPPEKRTLRYIRWSHLPSPPCVIFHPFASTPRRQVSAAFMLDLMDAVGDMPCAGGLGKCHERDEGARYPCIEALDREAIKRTIAAQLALGG